MERWCYQRADDLDRTVLGRLSRVPREPDLLCYALRSAAAVCVRAGLRVFHRFEIRGWEKLPGRGTPVVMVANHASHLDALCLLSALPLSRLHQAFPAAAEDYFFRTVPGTLAAAVFMNALPFSRRGQHVRHCMSLCHELLRSGDNVLVIFPEGTRSTSGDIGEFRRGVGDLLAGTDVPAVPCYLDGPRASLPKGALIPRPRKIRLTIGSPRTYAHLSHGKHSARFISEDLHDAVVGLAEGKDICHDNDLLTPRRRFRAA